MRRLASVATLTVTVFFTLGCGRFLGDINIEEWFEDWEDLITLSPGEDTTDISTSTDYDFDYGYGTTTADTTFLTSYLNPTYVSVEIIAAFDPSANAVSLVDAYGTATSSLVVLTFIGDFGPGDYLDMSQTCRAVALFGAAPDLKGVQASPLPRDEHFLVDGKVVDMHQAYRITLDLDVQDSDCGDVVDPTIWGEDAEDLLNLFDGTQIGVGFAPLESVDWDLGTATKDNDELYNSLFTLNVAFPGSDGGFEGTPLGIGVALELDSTTGEVVVDPNGELVFMDIGGFASTEPIAPVYVRSTLFHFLSLTTIARGPRSL